MTLTIGRFSTSASIRAGSLNLLGDVMAFDTMLLASSADEMKARVQQLRGLVDNPDETVFPFTLSEDSTLDGFYTDLSVSVAESGVMYVSPFQVRISVRMRRVPGGFALPLAETIVSSVIRTNSHGVASGSSHLVVPPQTDAPGSWYASGTNGSVGSEDGALTYNSRTAPVTTIALTAGVLPADWYKGSARVSVSYGGTYYPVVGQQIPRVQAVRIQNANFRMDVSASAVITLGLYDAAWESAPSFTLNQSGAFDSVGSVKVLRNGPDVVVVRLGLLAAAATTSPCTLDVVLHRGHRTACCVFTPHGFGTSSTLSIRAAVVTACSAITGGIQQTTADASGNKWFILSTSAATNDLTNGYRTTNAAVATREAFALGMVPSPFTGVDAYESFWCEYAESTKVISR